MGVLPGLAGAHLIPGSVQDPVSRKEGEEQWRRGLTGSSGPAHMYSDVYTHHIHADHTYTHTYIYTPTQNKDTSKLPSILMWMSELVLVFASSSLLVTINHTHNSR